MKSTIEILIIAATMLMSILSCSDDTENQVNDKYLQHNKIPETCIIDTCFTCNLSETAGNLYVELINAHNDSCLSCLKEFLNNWSNETDPVNQYELTNDTIINIYKIYEEFYTPWDMDRIIGNYEVKPISLNYCITQDSINYNFNFKEDSSFFGHEYFTLNNFRPSISNDTVKVIYHNQDYINALNCFLVVDYIPLDTEDDVIINFLNEYMIRQKFINQYLHVYLDHWELACHFDTYPEIQVISFNKELDSAQVFFSVGYEGGYAILGKENDEWNLINSNLYCIE